MTIQSRSFAGGRTNNNSPHSRVSAPLVPTRQGLGPSQKASRELSEMQESKGAWSRREMGGERERDKKEGERECPMGVACHKKREGREDAK